jgi:uncharacterized protein (TIGR03000 family)
MTRGGVSLVGALTCAFLLAGADQASAGWRHHRGWGSSGSSGYWGGSSGSSGYWGGSSGHWGHHGHWRGHGYWGGSSGYWGGSSGYWGGSSGGYYAPAVYPGAIVSPVIIGSTTTTPSQTNGIAPAKLVLNVPENATVYCADRKTTTTGTTRRYTVPITKSGESFTYPIRVEVAGDGKTRVARSQVTVRPGQTTEVTVTVNESEETLAVVQR